MKVYLNKKCKGSEKFISVEVDGYLLRVVEGRDGVSSAKRTRHCGTLQGAQRELDSICSKYKEKGYYEIKTAEATQTLVFDNAEWHYGGDFPSDLKSHQAFVHTGLFIGWLINNDLFDDNFKQTNGAGIDRFLGQVITGPEFFSEYMDGLFGSYQLSDEGIKFVKYYFGTDFTKSQYIIDLISRLLGDLPSLYHIKDSWENFAIISEVIDERFIEWRRESE